MKPKKTTKSIMSAWGAINALAFDYEKLGENPTPPQLSMTPPIKSQTKPASTKPQAKPANRVQKPPTKPATDSRTEQRLQRQQQGQRMAPMQLKVSSGKEFQRQVKLSRLNTLPIAPNVAELGLQKRPQNKTYMTIHQGVPAQELVQYPCINFTEMAFEVHQGQIGDCYLIAAMIGLLGQNSVLAHRITMPLSPNRLPQSFPVNIFESGKCVPMQVPNTFQTRFCKPIANNIGPALIEKAYAQVYGGYEAIVKGSASDAFRDLSGAPTTYISLKDLSQLRKSLLEALRQGYPIVVGSKLSPPHPDLSKAHSYNVIDSISKSNQLYLCLRDPRGWTKVSFPCPSDLEARPEMGLFWVSLANLQANFETVSTCQVRPKASYYYRSFGRESRGKAGLVLTNPRPSKWVFSIHQKHKKFFGEDHQYDVLRMLVAEISREDMTVIKTLKTNFNAEAVCAIDMELPPGRFLLLGQMGDRREKTRFPEEWLTLSAYGQGELSFEEVEGVEVDSYLRNYLCEHVEEFKESRTEKGWRRIHGALFGYICVYYENHSAKRVREEIEYGGDNYTVTTRAVELAPGDTQLVKHPLLPFKNCSHKCTLNAKITYT